jgi:hypothetical protein
MRPHSLILIISALVAAAPVAFAQYKWVGADGAVNYSDQPPAPGMQVKSLATPPAAPSAPKEAEAVLPLAVRKIAETYPVVLYTIKDCVPCAQARTHLVQRGIPYTERSVETQDEAQAFKQLGFADLNFPALGVGRERHTGFEAGLWNRLLDAAGYPKQYALPANWRQPPVARLGASASAAAGERAAAGALPASLRSGVPASNANAPIAPAPLPFDSMPSASWNATPTPLPSAGTTPGFRF